MKLSASASASGGALLIVLTTLLSLGCTDNGADDFDDDWNLDEDMPIPDASPDHWVDGIDENACTTSGARDLEGGYLVGIATSMNRGRPFLFKMNIRTEDDEYNVELQQLVHDGCPNGVGCGDSNARDEVGDSVSVVAVAADTEGRLELRVEDLEMPPAANPITRTAMNLDFTIEFSACRPQTLCGTTEVVVNSFDDTLLNGTFAAVEVVNLNDALVPNSCDINPYIGVVCGDDECLPSETTGNCPEDCDPDVADTAPHCTGLFERHAFAEYASSPRFRCYSPRDVGPDLAALECDAIECVVGTCSPDELQRVLDCTVEAFVDIVGLNSSCSECYGRFGTCQVLKCSPDCTNVPSSSECLSCLEANGCLSELTQCSGLPEDYDPCE